MLDRIEASLRTLGKIKQGNYSPQVRHARHTLLEQLKSNKFSPRLHQYMMVVNSTGEPFTEFETDPDLVSQVKKFINLLYYVELVLLAVENTSWDGFFRHWALVPFVMANLDNVYKAGQLATHLDIDLKRMFSQEIALGGRLFEKFKQYASAFKEGTNRLLADTNYIDELHTLGRISGGFIDQMGLKGGATDYEFLTQFGVDFTIHLESIGRYIERFAASQGSDSELNRLEALSAHAVKNIDRLSLDELQAHAVQIITAMKGLHGNSLFLPLEALRYLHLLRHTLALFEKIYAQTGHLHNSTQNLVRQCLTELKYQYLPLLFGAIDNLEAQAMLVPGTLSNPLLGDVSRMYQLLIKYTSKFVDFTTEGQSLSVLVEPLFIDKRLDRTYRRSADDEIMLIQLTDIKENAEQFFKRLKRLEQTQRIIELRPREKKLLRDSYCSMRAYVVGLNKDINAAIMKSLDGASKPSTSIRQQLDTVGLVIKELEQPINNLLDKAIASCKFHLQLNQDLMKSVIHNGVELALFEVSQSLNPFCVDEAQVLSKDGDQSFDLIDGYRRLKSLDAISRQDAEVLSQAYHVANLKLEFAINTYRQFHNMTRNPINTLADKKTIQDLYGVLQPYLLHAKNAKMTTEASSALNKTILATLLPYRLLFTDDGRAVVGLNYRNFKVSLPDSCMTPDQFQANGRALKTRCGAVDRILLERLDEERKASALIEPVDGPARANFLIAHQALSAEVNKLRGAVDDFMHIFNDSIQRLMGGRSTIGVPFPELDDLNGMLRQGSQELVLKRIFNALYYLDDIVKQLETLREDDSKHIASNKIIGLVGSGSALYLLMEALVKTPYLSVMRDYIQQKFKHIKILVGRFQDLYSPSPTVVNGIAAERAPIFYALNAIDILPALITATHTNAILLPTDTQRLHQSAEKISTDIMRILGKSNSYFKLFFEIPTIYTLFRQLKEKLLHMTTLLHQEVITGLSLIDDKLFAALILELDEKEDEFCLKPGTLTTLAQEMFDAFYKGLLTPLGLTTDKHISLLTSQATMIQRIDANNRRNEQASIIQKTIEKNITGLRAYLAALGSKKSRERRRDENYIVQETAALPILNQAFLAADGHIRPKIFPQAVEAQTVYDIVKSIPDNSTGDEKMREFTTACLDYFTGLAAGNAFTLKTSELKGRYLENLTTQNKQASPQTRQSMIEASFIRKLKHDVAIHPVDLKNNTLLTEYRERLHQSLNTGLPGIIESIDKQYIEVNANIDVQIETVIKTKMQEFHDTHYNDYLRLDRVNAAIDRWQRYVAQPHTVFEDADTLSAKREAVTALQRLAARNSPLDLPQLDCTVIQRLTSIQEYLREHEHTLQTTMCNPFCPPLISVECLLQCIVSFLELLHLYTPERKKCYNQLIQSIEPLDNRPPPSRFRFFSGSHLRADGLAAEPVRTLSRDPALA